MTLSTIERILFLRSAELFGQIASEDLVPVAQVAQEVHFNAGENFIKQGDVGECLYLIVDGEASISLPGVGEVARRSAKEAIGEMAIISRQPRSADCQALTDLTMLKIDYDEFWELLAEKPPLALGVIRTLAARLTEAVANLDRLSQKKIDSV
ncbi:MAG TPA: Crp/Fnr family transcriptional regulator [Anaerolineae bacterium]|jgi:CRP-like cAMP-binding protein|nr:Crp/Fnr family transcriptional regulator [Anaerolineae bacterium]